ncbi:MAG: radical SAM protein [Candidatus Aminicenantes bacterium]|nr:MAG: radical SAM protein [Candidatus Aminicenantes bacterium]
MRSNLRRLLTGEKSISLQQKIPVLEKSFQDIKELGVYLHIPFCEQICPYCPYNKEIYEPDVARKYTNAMKKEIEFYSDLIGKKPVTSFYIGGGTPTTMLYSGLEEILEHVNKSFNMQCEIHMESHPNHLSSDNLDTIISMGVDHLSIGVEALQDRHLKTLKRPYIAKEVKKTVERAVNKNFKCVNADVIFALPDQTYNEVEQAGCGLVEMGVHQVAAYPLFIFPYTLLGRTLKKSNYKNASIFVRRKMLGILERVFYDAGFRRTSVWAFTRPGVPKYCSVTVPLYVGLGASGGSYLKDVFYLNTFRVVEYINALEKGKMPIALSMDLSEKMQMAGWLYWRIYETGFAKKDFKKRFGEDFNRIYGRYVKLLSFLRFLNDKQDQIVLSDKGSYWLHVLEDLFSIDYISKLWGDSKQNPWPTKVIL